MKAHSAAVCQCSSRTPPAVRRMSTPAMLLETGSSRTVTSRDQPAVQALVGKRKGIFEGWNTAGIGSRRIEGRLVLRVELGIGGAGIALAPLVAGLGRILSGEIRDGIDTGGG